MREMEVTRFLPVTLTPEEVAAKANELAKATIEEGEEQADYRSWLAAQKEAKKVREGTLAVMRSDMARLAEIVETGIERRDVPCIWLYDLLVGKAFLMRTDTEELVKERVLAEDERQLSFGEVLQEPTPEQRAKWVYAVGRQVEEVPS